MVGTLASRMGRLRPYRTRAFCVSWLHSIPQTGVAGSPGVPLPLRDVALECPTESFCNTSRVCGACCPRCSQARPAPTCNKCNTLRGNGGKLIKDLPARTAAMSQL
jgi:hypothetical protein